MQISAPQWVLEAGACKERTRAMAAVTKDRTGDAPREPLIGAVRGLALLAVKDDERPCGLRVAHLPHNLPHDERWRRKGARERGAGGGQRAHAGAYVEMCFEYTEGQVRLE